MFKIYLREEIYADQVQMMIFQERDGKRYRAKPLEFELFESGLVIPEPTAVFPRDSNVPQQLKQELKAMGLIDNADQGTVNALKYHLEDMRTLVFDTTKEPKT